MNTKLLSGGGSGRRGFCGSGSNVSAFLDLTDTPASYVGEASNFVIVNDTEDGLEFVDHGMTDIIDF